MSEYTSKESTKLACEALADKKADDIKVIDISEVSSLADYFVIATAGSSTQAKALAEEVEFRLSQAGIEPDHIEGRNGNAWILLDYDTVIVHVFLNQTRDFYDLERLWKDGELLPLDGIVTEE